LLCHLEKPACPAISLGLAQDRARSVWSKLVKVAKKDLYTLGPKDTATTTQPQLANPSGPVMTAPILELN